MLFRSRSLRKFGSLFHSSATRTLAPLSHSADQESATVRALKAKWVLSQNGNEHCAPCLIVCDH